MRAALVAAVAGLLIAAAPAAAAPTLVKLGDFTDPVHVASPPDDDRVFVVEQGGLIKIVGGGTFIDLTGPTLTNASERGLLSIAFPPDYAASGLFYVFLTAEPSGNIQVREYRGTTLVRTLIDEPHNAGNHNGGQLQFGPDGALYASIGDNASGANAQNLSSPFGKILRIDLATGARSVWSYGLRNPWRFAFDPPTGDIIIGDVGEGTWEEIDWSQAPTSGNGVNWGWPATEGGPSATIAMDHSGADAFCAIVGGYVVRDPGLPTLNGRYLYGDNCHPVLHSAVARTGADNRPEALTVSGLSSFGTNTCGHIFVASRGSDAVYRLQDGAPSTCLAGGPVPRDLAAPKLDAAIWNLRKALKRRTLRIGVRCDEACQVRVASRVRRVHTFRPRTRSLAAGTRAVVKIKISKATARKIRRRMNRRGYVRVVVTLRVTDAAGNSQTSTERARLRKKS